MKIIDDDIRALVARIDQATEGSPELDEALGSLVARLKVNCGRPETVARYQSYLQSEATLEPLPVDEQGYVRSYCPLTQEDEFVESWRRYGIVASRQAASPELCAGSIARVAELMNLVSGGRCDLNCRETWQAMPVDEAQPPVPILSRGFFEIYHDRALAALRQSVRVYLHNVLIWGRPDLWTTFDRLGIKLPGHGESGALPLHVDQNPNIHPSFRTVQGVLALTDCPAERGTFVGVPGSRKLFDQYGKMAKNQGEYVELDMNSGSVAATLSSHAQACPLRAGDLISWDSRTTHANSVNISDATRVVAYVSTGLAKENDEQAKAARRSAFETGIGSNVRDAYMHASKPPRYTNPATLARVRSPERLSLLGRLLYGIQSYSEIPPAPADQR